MMSRDKSRNVEIAEQDLSDLAPCEVIDSYE